MPRNRYYTGPVTDHFDGARFSNIAPATRDKSLRDLIRWRRTSRPDPWPSTVSAARVIPDARSASTRVTIVGHATALIQTRGLNLVTDPVWSERVSPLSFLGPKRVAPPGVAFDDLPRIDAVLLSHSHYDHLDIATLGRLVRRDDPLILTPLGADAVVRRSIPAARLVTGDWWDRRRLSADVEVMLLPAQHWSARGAFDRRMALWCGFALDAGGEILYAAGDTGYGDGSLFRALRQRIGRPELALIPIGAYAPRWFMADQHVDPDEAVMILLDLDARHALGMHWGVFPLGDEGRDEPRETLTRALTERRIEPTRFVAAEPGLVWDAPG